MARSRSSSKLSSDYSIPKGTLLSTSYRRLSPLPTYTPTSFGFGLVVLKQLPEFVVFFLIILLVLNQTALR